MKPLTTILAILLLTITTFAQVPQKISYQALIRNAENEIVANRVITLQINLVTANGDIAYSETHQTATNANGVVSVAIGTGNTNDDFSQIDWSKGEYYVQTTTDLGAGEQLVSGNSPLLSVPYALYAEKAGNAVEVDLSDYYTKSEVDDAFADYTTTADLNTTLADYAQKDTLSNYAKKTEVAGLVDLSNYYKKSDVDNLLGALQAKVNEMNKELNKGSLTAVFSVSADKQIYFSQGNLQYQASTNTWRFAENQWTIVGTHMPNKYNYFGGTVEGSDNAMVSETYDGWIDLFAWGTSGWNSGANAYQPYSISESYSDYYSGGSYSNNLTGEYANADWGVYNAISNGGNQAGQWRTLTKDEWNYVINTRTDAASKKGCSTVNGVTGLVLLPDNWTLPNGLTFKSNNIYSSYSRNVYSVADWAKMEANGAVFLPAGGSRYGVEVDFVECYGYYNSSSAKDGYSAYYVYFDSNNVLPTNSAYNRCYGWSVRLVQDAE